MPVRIIHGWPGIGDFFSGEPLKLIFSREDAARRDAAELAKRTPAAFDRWLATQKSEPNKELPPFIIVHIIRHGSVQTLSHVRERHWLTV